MIDNLVANHEAEIRLGVFISGFLIMAVWEIILPRRTPVTQKLSRWVHNLSIVILNTILLRLLFPTAAIGAAYYAISNGWGLFNILNLPVWVEVVLCVVALDLLIYTQHVIVHKVPSLWRIHRVHHTDVDLDVSTGVRFHPIEIILSMCLKMAAIVILGAGVTAVFIFELLLNASSMFNHSNIRLLPSVDHLLRGILVTPDMHRVHHSINIEETNSNFGFNLPWWDFIFKTYRSQPIEGHQNMTLGLAEFRDLRRQRIWDLVLLPFFDRRS